jgi:hypothetical protein
MRVWICAAGCQTWAQERERETAVGHLQAAAGIPVNTRAVGNLAQHWFSGAPAALPTVVVIAAHPGLNVVATAGDLVRVSPQETVHAFILACAAACRAGAGLDELERWRKAMLTATFRFESILTVDALYWRAANLRELVVSEFRAVALTPVQRICQVVEFKAQQERKHGGAKLSAAALTQLFLDNLKMADDAEKLSKNLVDNILTVWNRALSQQAILEIVLDAEERFGPATPFDSILKMYTIVSKAQTAPAIKWVYCALSDLTRAGLLGRGTASLAALGHGGSGGAASLSHILAKKMQLRDVLLETWLPRLDKVRGKVKADFRLHFSSHQAFRAAVGWPDAQKAGAGDVDLSWRSDYSMGELLLRSWAEDLVFGMEYDPVLKQSLKLKKTTEEPRGCGPQIAPTWKHVLTC